MPRIRTLKPEHKQHRKIGPLSHITYRLWIGMITEADDDGRLVCDADQLRVTVFGYHANVRRAIVEGSLKELDEGGLIKLYVVEGIRYAWFPSWRDHQRIDRHQPSKLPPYDDSSSVRRMVDEHSTGIGRDRKGSEGKGEEAACAPPPEPSAIQFHIPDSIQQALSRAPILGAIPRLREPGWWQAQVRANGRRGIDFAAELLKAEAWLTTNPRRAPKHDHARFLHTWLGRAEAPHA